jgi:hypothetical protein
MATAESLTALTVADRALPALSFVWRQRMSVLAVPLHVGVSGAVSLWRQGYEVVRVDARWDTTLMVDVVASGDRADVHLVGHPMRLLHRAADVQRAVTEPLDIPHPDPALGVWVADDVIPEPLGH